MRPLRRPRSATIHYHGFEYSEGINTITFSINGVRWEYDLLMSRLDKCLYILRKGGTGKGLAYAKRYAERSRCLDQPSPVMATLLRHRGGQASRNKRIKVTLPNV